MEKEVNKNIGLQFEISNLSPFLNTDFTIENFNLVRKIPEERNVQELKKWALNFKIWLIFHHALLYIYGIKCSYAQPSKAPLSGPEYKHFIYVMRSITLHKKSCINIDFWKQVVSNHGNSTVATRWWSKVPRVFTGLISRFVFW